MHTNATASRMLYNYRMLYGYFTLQYWRFTPFIVNFLMKILKYNLYTRVNHGTEESPVWKDVFSPVEMDWNEVNEEITKREAYNGEYTIEDDGQAEPEPVETTDDVLNALLGVTG